MGHNLWIIYVETTNQPIYSQVCPKDRIMNPCPPIFVQQGFPLVMTNIAIEHHLAIHGKTHYFYGHFNSYVKLPEGLQEFMRFLGCLMTMTLGCTAIGLAPESEEGLAQLARAPSVEIFEDGPH